MRGLRILSVGLSFIFVVWAVEFLLTYDHWRKPPEVRGTGNAFEGTTQLPAADIKQAVDEARSRMIEINQRGRRFTLAGDISAWLTFGCTSAVTLIAGWLGRSPGAGDAGPDTGGLPPGPPVQLPSLPRWPRYSRPEVRWQRTGAIPNSITPNKPKLS
jgi:hypothetical protein